MPILKIYERMEEQEEKELCKGIEEALSLPSARYETLRSQCERVTSGNLAKELQMMVSNNSDG